jgi:hypothetical protein
MDASSASSDDTRRMEIVVIVNSEAEPITGFVSDGAGRMTAFVGYARLVAAIEHHRDSIADALLGQQNATGDDRGRDDSSRARTRARADSDRA